MDWKEKERGIGHFQSYTKHSSPPEIDNGLEGKGKSHWSLPVIHAYTKHNSPPEIDTGLEGKGKRHWSLPVIRAHTKHNSHSEDDDGRKTKKHWLLLVI